MASKARKTILFKEKLKIIQKIEGGKKQKDVAEEHKLLPTTVSGIWKKRAGLISHSQHANLRGSRMRKPDFPKTEKALIKWFDDVRSAQVRKLTVFE